MIISVEEYKALTGSKAPDEQIKALIDVAEKDYMRIRRKPFDISISGDVIYPDGSKATAAAMVSYLLSILPGSVGLSSETIGDYSASFQTSDLLNGYPRHIVTSIRRYARSR